jgi:hypothetical protein
MSDRRQPDSLSWAITASTVFAAERAHYELDGDRWVLEHYNIVVGAWEPINPAERLRLTVHRDSE